MVPGSAFLLLKYIVTGHKLVQNKSANIKFSINTKKKKILNLVLKTDFRLFTMNLTILKQ